MRILIIAGAGLIGSAIVRRLLDRGHAVTAVDRVGPSRLPPGVASLTVDRRDFASFEAAVAGSGPWDAVIDMICFRPDEAESAVRAVRGHTAHYIMTSTIDVYRKPASRYPYTEAEGFGGLGEYARGKVACERILWAAHEQGDLPLTVIRPGATYGVGHGPVHILGARFYADRLRRGKPIVVHGDGSSFWPSCYVDDTAGAFEGAVDNVATIGRAYHVTGEEWVTWDQHHRIVAEAIGAPPPTLVHIPTDVLARLAPDRTDWVVDNFRFNNLFDNSAAHRDLGFQTTVPLREGAARWYAALEAAGGIEDSDLDPFEDRLIALWSRHVDAATSEAIDSL
jgi:nucleoside-diphosphate-sugar epimerase